MNVKITKKILDVLLNHLFLVCLCFLFVSCGKQDGTAKLWTDRPEFAFYAQYFNSSQNKYKIEVRQFDALAQSLLVSKERPDIIVGSWLKSSKTISRFKSLNEIIRKNNSLKKKIYESLLNIGKVGKRQLLLPVSFDLPLIIFSEENSHLVKDNFLIDIREVKTLGLDFNKKTNDVFTHKGFSPLWNNDFLFETARMMGAGFQEANPVEWNKEYLASSIDFLKDWIDNVNGGVVQEDEFFYKYFFNPPEKLIQQGRILFAYMRSTDFFNKTEQHTNMDFRLLSDEKIIPVYEGAVYYGLDKKSKGAKACEAFTLWFFKESTQELLLEESRKLHLNDTSFGIAGGYSAMRTVTENIFPRFYPELLGHLPPQEYLMPSKIKPLNWNELKERVIIPYIREECRGAQTSSTAALDQAVSEWIRTTTSEFVK
ncbi:MAG: extracellular solute-binding protein [Termitinemataceae bacterium]|nr:MAG: extracellular solute-binding protein [Termitinemataceae bacterium]